MQLFKAVAIPLGTSIPTLECDDGNGRIVFSKDIEYTDFPLDEIVFYFTDNVLMLTSEY